MFSSHSPPDSNKEPEDRQVVLFPMTVEFVSVVSRGPLHVIVLTFRQFLLIETKGVHFDYRSTLSLGTNSVR
jgi:hypothetical protein